MALEFCKCGLGREWGLQNVCKVCAAHLGRCHALAEAVCGSKVLIQLSKELCWCSSEGGAVKTSAPDKLNLAIKEVREKVLF